MAHHTVRVVFEKATRTLNVSDFEICLYLSVTHIRLVEQILYLDQRGGNNSLQHTYMATKVDDIATALRDYAQVKYPAVYSDSSITFDSYKAMAFKGLTGTQGYLDYVNSLPNGLTSFVSLYGFS